MRLMLQVHNQTYYLADRATLTIGANSGSDIGLAGMERGDNVACIHSVSAGLCLLKSAETGIAIHHNGCRVAALAFLRAGDELYFDSTAVQVKSEHAPIFEKPSCSNQAINFGDRILLRIRTGAQTGKAFVLINSLCIGRSSISEIVIDDLGLAERQILLQRQGNDVWVKNLAPSLEMRVDGWVCDQAILKAGSQINIEQHRFVLESSMFEMVDTSAIQTMNLPQMLADVESVVPQVMRVSALFSRAQWILLASAVVIAGLLVVLLSVSS
jgi:hypothetical protein